MTTERPRGGLSDARAPGGTERPVRNTELPAWLTSGPASPEMIGAMRARMEQLLGEYDKVRANLAAMRSRLREAEASARSRDGGIELTVGPQGALRTLTIDPRAYRKLSPTELADEILRLSEAATADVRRQLRDVMAPFLPAGVSYEQMADGSVDPGQWAPERPLTAETFDQWWSTFGGGDGPGPGGADG